MAPKTDHFVTLLCESQSNASASTAGLNTETDSARRLEALEQNHGEPLFKGAASRLEASFKSLFTKTGSVV